MEVDLNGGGEKKTLSLCASFGHSGSFCASHCAGVSITLVLYALPHSVNTSARLHNPNSNTTEMFRSLSGMQ